MTRKGRIIGHVSVAGLLGNGPVFVPVEPSYKYEGREADDPRRLPSHMNRVGTGRKLGWECEGCGASSPLHFRGIPSLAADARRHDRDECK